MRFFTAFKRFIFLRNLAIAPRHVNIYEVGPRDGLQNQKQIISSEDKIKMIDTLSLSGLKEIEVTSIVSPKWVPQLGDYDKVLRGFKRMEGVSYSILVPNLKGITKAAEYGIQNIAIVSSASDTFSKKNMNCSIEESLTRIKEVAAFAASHNMKLRGYLSSCFFCPYEGPIDSDVVKDICIKLRDIGCYEIVICDTLGAAKPENVSVVLEKVLKHIPVNEVAVHYHNTHGHGIENVLCSVSFGISKVDSSSGGLGGCPYAKSAKGNIGTEDVICALEDQGITTGVNLDYILKSSRNICNAIGIDPPSLIAQQLLAKSKD